MPAARILPVNICMKAGCSAALRRGFQLGLRLLFNTWDVPGTELETIRGGQRQNIPKPFLTRPKKQSLQLVELRWGVTVQYWTSLKY